MCAACTSPSMRASDDTISVLGWSAIAPTLPRTMPSTRRPPLKITLPSMRVVAPMRLSMRFCGLLVLLLNMFAPSQRHRVRRAGLVRPRLVYAHLDILDLRLGVNPEDAFHAAEVLECQPELGRPCVPGLREGDHSILAPVRQSDDQLEPAVELPLAP